LTTYPLISSGTSN